MLDLPAARHLLHHQFGIHEYLNLGGIKFPRDPQTFDQAPVLRHVVGGSGAHHIGDLPEDLLLVVGVHHGAGAGDTGISAGTAVGLDNQLH